MTPSKNLWGETKRAKRRDALSPGLTKGGLLSACSNEMHRTSIKSQQTLPAHFPPHRRRGSWALQSSAALTGSPVGATRPSAGAPHGRATPRQGHPTAAPRMSSSCPSSPKHPATPPWPPQAPCRRTQQLAKITQISQNPQKPVLKVKYKWD